MLNELKSATLILPLEGEPMKIGMLDVARKTTRGTFKMSCEIEMEAR